MDKASRCEGLQPSTHPFSEGLLCCCCCGWKEGGQRLGSSDFPQAAVIPISATPHTVQQQRTDWHHPLPNLPQLSKSAPCQVTPPSPTPFSGCTLLGMRGAGVPSPSGMLLLSKDFLLPSHARPVHGYRVVPHPHLNVPPYPDFSLLFSTAQPKPV